METPIYNISKYPTVYEPYEDTFLLIDALEKDLIFIKSLQPKLVAEIGCGSGVNIAALAKSLGESVFYCATDINKDACLATMETSKLNNVTIEVFNVNFLDSFRKNVFDLIVFNPPYVVTDSNEIFGNGIERSWAGGIKGREVIDKLLPLLPDLLTINGLFYLVTIKENQPDEIIGLMRDLNFDSKIVIDRRILREHLYVLRFQKR